MHSSIHYEGEAASVPSLHLLHTAPTTQTLPLSITAGQQPQEQSWIYCRIPVPHEQSLALLEPLYHDISAQKTHLALTHFQPPIDYLYMLQGNMAATADAAEHAASTVLATSSARSLTLPNEVLSMIASECDPIDLKNMRLASKLMRQVSTESFARRKFSRRRFLFTYQSMKALVDITAHPDFGPHLTCFTFGTYRLEETPYDNDDGYNDRSARYDIKEAMHKNFINRGHHVRMLSLALENLKKCHSTGVILGVHDDVESGAVRVRGYAFEASYDEFCPQVNHMSETLKALRLARDRSGYPITTQELFLTPGSGSLEVLARFDPPFSASSTHPGPDLDIFLQFWSTNSRWVPQSPKLRILSNFTRLELSRHHLGRNVN